MKDNKGQALIEFILILPIFLLILISIIDFGNILTKKYNLENKIDVVYNLYIEGQDINNYLSDENIKVGYKTSDKFTTIVLKKSIKLNSPVLVAIYGKNFEITSEKSVFNE